MNSATTLLRVRALSMPALATPAALFAVAFAARLVAAFVVRFPLTEGSAYYVGVARNIAEGRGAVIDAVWSYATPPLTLPGKPAFELWQPLASVIAAAPMVVLGPGYSSAQLAFAVLGALLAPLAWLVARDACQRLELPENRQQYVAVGAGVLVAVGGPFVLSAAIPDSTLPFSVLAVAACVVMPRAVSGSSRTIVALGLLLGLAHLTRIEAVYLGVVVVALAWQAGVRSPELVRRIGAVAVVGGIVALPWWLRNVAVFGTPMPGQLADNAFLTTNEQIFSFMDRPTLAGFLAQGPATIAAHVGQAAWHNLVDVLLVPGNVIAVAGIATLALGWRSRTAVTGSPLTALLAYGGIAFLVSSVVFPVATLWGTFEHAAGPLLVALAVMALLGADALVARVRQWRSWPRPNAGMAPAALTAVVVAMTTLQLLLAGAQATSRERQLKAAAGVLTGSGIAADQRTLMTDRPVWLSDALGAPTIVVPRENPDAIPAAAKLFDARYVVMLSAPLAAQPCLLRQAIGAPPDAPDLAVYQIAETCR